MTFDFLAVTKNISVSFLTISLSPSKHIIYAMMNSVTVIFSQFAGMNIFLLNMVLKHCHGL